MSPAKKTSRAPAGGAKRGGATAKAAAKRTGATKPAGACKAAPNATATTRTAATKPAGARKAGSRKPAAKTAGARKSRAGPVPAKPAAGKRPASPGAGGTKAPATARVATRPGRRGTTASPGAAKPAGAGPQSLAELMSQALTMEIEAAERYTEFADAMEVHNNRAVAALFRKMADIETRHAQQIMGQMRWTAVPAPLAASWEGFEPPETSPGDEVHYLMQPYHALELALACEERAERFFARLAAMAIAGPVRKAARALQAEEREHVLLVRAWMAKVPQPDAEWAHDPDPPVYNE